MPSRWRRRHIAARLVGGGAEALDSWLGGHFSIVHIDLAGLRACFVTDRFSVFPICYATEGKSIAFADRANAVPVQTRHIDLQSIYHYVYFHVIPAPRTIFREVWRMEAATQMQIDAHGSRSARWWRPVFAADAGFRRRDAGEELRGLLRAAVEGSMRSDTVGAYLSGGTDSSTVAGMLGLASGRPARTYSIGFSAKGYDEMTYARIAAKHFGTQHHELYVGPEHVAQGIPIIAAGYDQPFGNSSALPAYFCAKMAHDDGIDLLLAGDGGDELFGGNVRYARQKVFEVYRTLPQSLRAQVDRAAPARHNMAAPLARRGQDGELRRAGPCSACRRERKRTTSCIASGHIRCSVRNCSPQSTWNSRLACRRTPTKRSKRPLWSTACSATIGDSHLTDNDLPKVSVTAALAGIGVGFPLLDDSLVDFSLHLPAEQKVRRLRLRHFFKNSLTGFLPDEIVRKKKHGFGLPIGPWLLSEPDLFAISKRAIEGLVSRRLVRPEFAEDLLSAKLTEHAGFYGEIVWVLLMLEHWLMAHAPQFALDS